VKQLGENRKAYALILTVALVYVITITVLNIVFKINDEQPSRTQQKVTQYVTGGVTIVFLVLLVGSFFVSYRLLRNSAQTTNLLERSIVLKNVSFVILTGLANVFFYIGLTVELGSGFLAIEASSQVCALLAEILIFGLGKLFGTPVSTRAVNL
jgi:hypothetical protein